MADQSLRRRERDLDLDRASLQDLERLALDRLRAGRLSQDDAALLAHVGCESFGSAPTQDRLSWLLEIDRLGGRGASAYTLLAIADACAAPRVGIRGDGIERSEILATPLTIGRGLDVDLRLEHASVSRRHCRLEVVEGGVRVVNCSGHGLLLDGNRVEESQTVRTGDHMLQLGKVLLWVSCVPAPDHWARTLELARARLASRSAPLGDILRQWPDRPLLRRAPARELVVGLARRLLTGEAQSAAEGVLAPVPEPTLRGLVQRSLLRWLLAGRPPVQLPELSPAEGRYTVLGRLAGEGDMRWAWDRQAGRPCYLRRFDPSRLRRSPLASLEATYSVEIQGLQSWSRPIALDGALAGPLAWRGGPSLREWTHGRSPRESVAAAIGLCSTLEQLHALGVVHDEFDPHDVLVDPTGLPCLPAVGLRELQAARLGAGKVAAVDPWALSFASPESLNWQEPERLAGSGPDVYRIGAVLAFSLTRRPVFSEDRLAGLMLGEAESLPDLGGVPVALEPVLLRALAQAPADRYASAAELREALEGACSALEAAGE